MWILFWFLFRLKIIKFTYYNKTYYIWTTVGDANWKQKEAYEALGKIISILILTSMHWKIKRMCLVGRKLIILYKLVISQSKLYQDPMLVCKH